MTRTIENPLSPGRYFVHCGVSRDRTADVVLYVHDCVDFVVFGGEPAPGIVALPHKIAAPTRRGRRRVTSR